MWEKTPSVCAAIPETLNLCSLGICIEVEEFRTCATYNVNWSSFAKSNNLITFPTYQSILVKLAEPSHWGADGVGQGEVDVRLLSWDLVNPQLAHLRPSFNRFQWLYEVHYSWDGDLRMDLDLGFLTSVLEAAFSHLSLMYLGTLTSQTPLWLFSRSKSLSDFLLPLLDPAPLLDITCALV